MDQAKLAKIKMQMREWDRTRQDRSFHGDSTSFDIGDRVRYFSDGQWSEVGEIVETRTHGSDMAQSYHIKTLRENLCSDQESL